MTRRIFGQLEWEILQIIQKQGKSSVWDVCHQLKNKSSYTTVMTVMTRLVEKNELEREKDGRRFLYWTPQKQKKKWQPFLEKMKQKLFNGRSASMISFLIESSEDLNEAELKELQKLVENKKKERS